jgi:hypothetical protein
MGMAMDEEEVVAVSLQVLQRPAGEVDAIALVLALLEALVSPASPPLSSARMLLPSPLGQRLVRL